MIAVRNLCFRLLFASKNLFKVALWFLYIAMLFSIMEIPVFGQGLGTSGTIQGDVLDPSGAAIPKANVQIINPVSGYQ